MAAGEIVEQDEQAVQAEPNHLDHVIEETQRQRGYIDFASDGSVRGYDFDGLWRLAQMYSRSKMVPVHFQGQTADCAIAIQMAQRCKVDIFAYLQNCYIVHGKPGLEAKFAIAMLNNSGKIKGVIDYEATGEDATRSCRAKAVDATTGEVVYGPSVSWDMVRKEKWDQDKKSQISKWKTMPELMFCYRSAIFFVRTRYPEVLLGMETKDELEDYAMEQADDTKTESTTPAASVSDILAGEIEPREVISEAAKNQAVGAVVKETPEPPPAVPEPTPEPEAKEPESDPADSVMVKDSAAMIAGCETGDALTECEQYLDSQLMSPAERTIVSTMIVSRRKTL